MRRTALLAIVVALGLLLSDTADALTSSRRADLSAAGLAVAQGDAELAGEAVLVARRRKKKRRKKRRPKPAAEEPAAAPDLAPAPEADPMGDGGSAPAATGGSLSRTSRVDFDAQLIKGQTTKAGEVQILERKDSELKSMVKRRTSFRDEIIHTVFPEKKK